MKVIAPRKEFKDISVDDDGAAICTIMPNVFRASTDIKDGVIKQCELKFANIVPQPVQSSVMKFMKDNYTEEQ